jgi:hypothetical protein
VGGGVRARPFFSHDVQNDPEAHLASILTYTLTRTAGA